VAVHPDRLDRHPQTFEVPDRRPDVLDLERQVPQPARLRVARRRGRDENNSIRTPSVSRKSSLCESRSAR